MKKNSKVGVIILFGFIVIAFSYDFIFKKLMRGGDIINGRIVDYGPGGKNASISIKYEYRMEGRSHIKSTSYSNITQADGRNFISKNVPLIYSKKINSIRLLLTPADFKKYEIPFPDSMRWVLDYIAH